MRPARLLVAAAVVALAACNSSGDEGASTTASGTAVTTPASDGGATTAPVEPTTTVADTAVTTVAPVAPTDPSPITADDVRLEEFGTFEAPIALTSRSSEPGVVYVAERDGRIRRVPLDGGDGDVVLDITDDTTTDAERGLLGIAFAPDGGLLYVSYTDNDGNSHIDEYGVADDGTVDTESRRSVLEQDQPYPNHNGGDLAFGPDGYLYFGLGDGGAANDPDRNGLDTGTLLGKLVRIDPETPSDGRPYTIPADNPFVDSDGARPEIWAVGLRNPWRFSFDRVTGDLWIGDVGQDAWEEVDVARAADGGGSGIDFGWSAFEGTHRFNNDQTADDATPPLLEYPHGDEGCSVTGGYVYRGTEIPALVGTYVFGDYCSGRIWGVQVGGAGDVSRVEIARVPTLVSFGEDAGGELYAVSLDGTVSRFTRP